MNKLKLAKQLAELVHKGQVDKGNNPYIEHPKTVAKMCKTKNQKIVAYLHDTIEDTYATTQLLKLFGFSNKIINAVDAITRRKDEQYSIYLQRVKQNKLATAVKIADLTHNSNIKRIANATQKDIDRCNRYVQYIKILKDN